MGIYIYMHMVLLLPIHAGNANWQAATGGDA